MRKKKVHSRDFIKFSEALSSEIRRRRIEKGYTLEECEERSKGRVKWRHLQKIETYSSKNIEIDTLFNICKVLKVQPYELFADISI